MIEGADDACPSPKTRSRYNIKALSQLRSSLSDFQNEVSEMEYIASELSDNEVKFKIIFTPKYHCEMAGEGIEYSWGFFKKWFRKQPLSDRQSCKTFVESTKRCISRVDIEMTRKFARRAREHMMIYVGPGKEASSLSHSQIEEMRQKMRKPYKSHRDTAKFDEPWLLEVVKKATFVNETEQQQPQRLTSIRSAQSTSTASSIANSAGTA